MRQMSTQWSGPWICCGDFNEVLSQDEHYGSNDRSETQIRLFQECLDDCALSDMGFSGPMFTWTNKQNNDRNVRVRLDWAVANGLFTQIFDDCMVENVITTTSDHYAVSISLQSFNDDPEPVPVQMGFKFEAAWLRSPDYMQVMEQAWKDGSQGPSSLRSTWATLHRVATSLGQWSKDTFGSVGQKIRKLECEF
jgi:hypothetical protein